MSIEKIKKYGYLWGKVGIGWKRKGMGVFLYIYLLYGFNFGIVVYIIEKLNWKEKNRFIKNEMMWESIVILGINMIYIYVLYVYKSMIK